MKSPLDTQDSYTTLDPDEVSYGVQHFPEQFIEQYEAVKAFDLQKTHGGAKAIVVLGMGGSQLGPHIIESALGKELSVPFVRVYGYGVPSFVDKDTLVILSSFSGTTEEVLEAGKLAVKKGAKVLAISAGGALAQFAKRHGIPHCPITPGELAKEPRLGVGFSLMGIVGMLASAGYLAFDEKRLKTLVGAMAEVVDSCDLDVPVKENPAKLIAESMKGRLVFFVSAEHLVGNAHTFCNQTNESGKQLAFWHTLPELNHHFLEGTAQPIGAFEEFVVVMLKSAHYHKRVQKRFEITADILEEQGAQVVEYHARGKSPLEEAVELLTFGNFVSYYLAMLNGVNPREIPFVNRFKEAMKT